MAKRIKKSAPLFLIAILTIGLTAVYLYIMLSNTERNVIFENTLLNRHNSLEQTYGVAASAGQTIGEVKNDSLVGDYCPDGLDKNKNLLRPIGVMLAGDAVTRPLSGIGQADVVIEMPVITRGINRFLALFQCTDAKEIGSVRSARDDFIPLAAAFDAVYAHWGGSHFALDELKKKIIDNLDALQNRFGAYYRKKGIAAPNNGFSNLQRLRDASQRASFRVLQNPGYGYKRINKDQTELAEQWFNLDIKYPGTFAVRWVFDPDKKTFLRFRGETKEVDKNTGLQVASPNVIIIKTTSRQIEGQYNDVKVTGRGEAIIYRTGKEIKATWDKDINNLSARLLFLDEQGQEIPLVPGKIWLEYIDQKTNISYTPVS